MPVDITEIEAEFPVPFGRLGDYTLYVNGTTEYNFSEFKVVQKLNQMSSFEFTVEGINRLTDTNLREKNIITFFVENSLFLKGRIEKVEHISDETCCIKGFGMEVKLLDNAITNRTQYTATASDTIVGTLLSKNNDNAAPWILNKGTINNYGNITIRGEYDNKLKLISDVANACTNSDGLGYNWWISQDQADWYATDYFNMTSYKGSSTSVLSLNIQGDDQNSVTVSNEQDIKELWNYVTVLGYGDGENQLKTNFYDAATTHTILTTALTSSGTSATVADGTQLDASGTCIIGEEQCTYTRSGNTLTLTRGTGGTTAKAHPANIYIADYIAPTEAASETGSSINTYGVKTTTMTDVTITDELTLQTVASRILLEHMLPLSKIIAEPMDALETILQIETGDKITVVDVDRGLNGDYRVVGLELDFDQNSGFALRIEVSNRQCNLIEQLQNMQSGVTTMASYSQGATNIWGDTQQGNASATVPLSLNFYVPTNVVDSSGKVKLNSAKLSYKSADYKKYVAASLTGSPTVTGTPGITNAVKGASDVGYDYGEYTEALVGDNTWKTAANSVTIISGTWLFHGIHGFFRIDLVDTDGVAYAVNNSVWVRVHNLTDSTYFHYFPDETGYRLSGGYYIPGTSHNHGGADADVETGYSLTLPIYIHIPYNLTGKNYALEYKISNEEFWNKTPGDCEIIYFYHGSQGHTHGNTVDAGTLSGASGTLATAYGLSEVTTTSTNTTIKIYNSGGTLLWNSGLRGQTTENEVDISAYITGSGYYRVDILPNADATMYGTIEIKSGVDSV